MVFVIFCFLLRPFVTTCGHIHSLSSSGAAASISEETICHSVLLGCFSRAAAAEDFLIKPSLKSESDKIKHSIMKLLQNY